MATACRLRASVTPSAAVARMRGVIFALVADMAGVREPGYFCYLAIRQTNSTIPAPSAAAIAAAIKPPPSARSTAT